MRNRRQTFFILVTIFSVIIVSLVVSEIILRIIPYPGLEKKVSKFNKLVGTGFQPHAIVIYRNKRGDYTKRKVNRWGFLDSEWEEKKVRGTYRIGFFGDSFTEARQVPLEQTFFSLIEENSVNPTVECLSFGISEFGTLQSYLTSKNYMNKFDLDMVVYVFYENDPGDNLQEIKDLNYVPYADVQNDSLIIDKSFIEKNRYRKSLLYKTFNFTLKHTVLFNTVYQRIRLIYNYGIQPIRQTIHEKLPIHHNIDQNQPPSTWPDSLYSKAQVVTEKIILQWKKEVDEAGKQFVVLYIPHPNHWFQPTEKQDSWKKSIMDFTEKHNIVFIDPTNSFWQYYKSGCGLYYDHLTSCGHKALSTAFLDWFQLYYNQENNDSHLLNIP
jgi:hypothetical protein